QEIPGSEFKEFKNLEILKELEEKVPEEAKEVIHKAQENVLKRIQGDLEKMSSEDQAKFKEYIENIAGNKEKQMEILDDLKEKLQEKPIIRQKLLETQDRIIEKIRTRTREFCAQVITYRENPQTGQCQQFSSPCDAPEDWQECVGAELLPTE
ncbi:MAG: hypothetical protein Q8M94_13450, partial [Ignavibacteria bacterium]|nr:hypothetical protein [Ignavibacteria bacterium]